MSVRLHDLLARSADRWPDRYAVATADGSERLTYRELAERAGSMREALERHGVGPGDRVAVYAPKSPASLSAILGILQSGAAYVPVDASAPPARAAYVVDNCGVAAVVAAAELLPALRDAGSSELRSLERWADGSGDREVEIARGPGGERAGDASDPIAYILYTSGSTGRPKGVVHTHGSAMSFVEWCARTFDLSEKDRFSSHAPFHFDLSIFDLYVSLYHGGEVVLFGEEVSKQPAAMADAIAERKISVWYSTPSVLRLLVEFGHLDARDWTALRLVLFAGEVFPIKHLRRLLEEWPVPRYYNLYGPTETNVCTYFEVPMPISADREEPFPIGRVCDNDEGLVVDEDDRPVASGDEGELLIRGGTVMQGYWNLPERTATAFYVDADGGRWYRTGDLVREDVDGTLLFAGRRDRMVKRRGYRVELGEIETALYRHPDIVEAAVVALPGEDGISIDAFVCRADGGKGSIIEMKTFCSKELPLYMIPDRFQFRPSLPKTSTDKVDYQALTRGDT
ncbi:MAG TPA: amino acid adenylation domain-containing protein [Gemmatimonadota bacterium]|nr:amino acid adenylation domain-containing protein [Gemmatimonadota bacterium]